MTRPALGAPVALLAAPELRDDDGMDVIARARAHAERGRSRAAIELLKPLAAAEHPRTMPAGRWRRSTATSGHRTKRDAGGSRSMGGRHRSSAIGSRERSSRTPSRNDSSRSRRERQSRQTCPPSSLCVRSTASVGPHGAARPTRRGSGARRRVPLGARRRCGRSRRSWSRWERSAHCSLSGARACCPATPGGRPRRERAGASSRWPRSSSPSTAGRRIGGSVPPPGQESRWRGSRVGCSCSRRAGARPEGPSEGRVIAERVA